MTAYDDPNAAPGGCADREAGQYLGPVGTAIHDARAPSNWARWLVTSANNGWAKETLRFLERAFDHLPIGDQRRVLNRLRKPDPDGADLDSCLHELLVYEVCRLFELAPTYEPKLGGKTPDLALKIADRSYVADVFLTSRPRRTLRKIGARSYRDRGEAAKKIEDDLAIKASRYRGLLVPLILFVAFGGRDVGLEDLETALYGATLQDLRSAEGQGAEAHGIFRPAEGLPPHPEISAVVACDWFDTAARDKPGRRLHCVVYHHPEPSVELPPSSFGRFPEVRWSVGSSGRLVPTTTGVLNIVMSTTSTEDPEWAPYAPDNPW